MKIIFVASIVIFSLAGCRKSAPEISRKAGPSSVVETQKSPVKAERPMVVVNDGWWSGDFAAEGAKMRCHAEGLASCEDESNERVKEARVAEAEFEGRLSAAFQSDPICSNVTLRGFGGRKHRISNPSTALEAGGAVADLEANGGYWLLIIDFVPESEKQSWSMVLQPLRTNDTSGDGDARSITHTVCSIVKGTGGSVAE